MKEKTESAEGQRYQAEPEVGVVKGMMQTGFRIVDKETDSRVATCYLPENADLIVKALNDYHRSLNAPPVVWASLNGSDVTAFYAFDPGAGAEPLYRRAPPGLPARVAWNAAITLANNICVQESDRANDDDRSFAATAAEECARRIRAWINPSEEQFNELLVERTKSAT